MVYLTEIVDYINVQLRDKLNMYPTARYYPVTNTVIKIKPDNTQISFPAVIDLFGSADEIKFDKFSPFSVWHKANTTVFIRNPDKSYGDNQTVGITSTTTMQMVCIGERKQINIKPEQLAFVLSDVLPTYGGNVTIDTQKLANLSITPININYNSLNVFNGEFSNVGYFIGPEMFMFSLNYTIVSNYLQGCADKCIC